MKLKKNALQFVFISYHIIINNWTEGFFKSSSNGPHHNSRSGNTRRNPPVRCHIMWYERDKKETSVCGLMVRWLQRPFFDMIWGRRGVEQCNQWVGTSELGSSIHHRTWRGGEWPWECVRCRTICEWDMNMRRYGRGVCISVGGKRR